MNVASFFDGISCGQIALQKLGMVPTKYFASEIDRYAIKATQYNFPSTIQLGSIAGMNYEGGRFTSLAGDGIFTIPEDVPHIDLMMGGSPCTGFSFAGKGLNFDDPQSKLFFDFVRLKNQLKPTYFLLENVKMLREHEVIISKYLGVEPIEINSGLLSAQSRERLYWTNINASAFTLFGDLKANIPQPRDKKLLINDIRESSVDPKYFITQMHVDRIKRHKERHIEKAQSFQANISTGNSKSHTISNRYYKGGEEQLLAENPPDSRPSIPANEIDFSYGIRKLTPIEVCRLQTVPDTYFYDAGGGANSKRYKNLCGTR